MHMRTPQRRRCRLPSSGWRLLLAVVVSAGLAACSDDALSGLGGRSSGWIGEVATTATTTTTTAPARTRTVVDVDWVNDQFEEPEPEAEGDDVLAAVFARSGDSSRFLQASRAEIVAVTPDVLFPSTVPAEVRFITSQLVIESRTLRLANDPTVAFGLWSVEPYTRSRSVGQVAVINVATDPAGAELAADPNTEPNCAPFSQENRLCSIEFVTDIPVWRLEGESGLTHVWYSAPYRYSLDTRRNIDEELVHTVIGSVVPLAELLSDQQAP